MAEPPVIALFPLGIVVFPGERRRLHIFENRYKQMIAQCRETTGEPIEFGISLIEGKDLRAVGCSVAIAHIDREYEDGRLDITIIGKRRYRVVEVYRDKIFLRAAVQYFEDEEEVLDERLRRSALIRFRAVVDLHLDQQVSDASETQNAFTMAGPVCVEVGPKQMILESVSENRRLQLLIEYLDRHMKAIEKQNRARSNGHTIRE